MKRKITLTLLLVFCLAFAASAQQAVGDIKGKVVSRQGRNPIEGARVSLDGTSRRVSTDQDGSFTFEGVEYGIHRLTIDAADFQSTELNVKLDVPTKDINIVTLASAFMKADLDDSSFVEFDSDASNESQSTPVSLAASKDVFDNIAGYKFGQLRFRTRGYESNTETVFLNGIDMSDAMSGNSAWSLWSGLNEATRNQESTYATSLGSSGLGGINGSTNILARASQMRQGFRTSVVTASGQYRFRYMATYASGMQDNGWAYAASFSTRQGGNDYAEGINYNAWAYFLSAEKRFNNRHQIALTFFGVPTERGAQMAATDEAFALAGSYYYNPNVGIQAGKLRNSRVRTYHEPVAMVNYFFTPDEKTKLTASASYRFGTNGYSALDWYNSEDPRPDYYRKLPSYWSYKGDQTKMYDVARGWLNNPNTKYIDFDALYDINRNSNSSHGNQPVTGLNGEIIGGNRSHYIISSRHTDQRDLRLKLQGERTIASNRTVSAGIDFRKNRTEYYTAVKDLLGGDYWLNIDNFADRDVHSAADETTKRNDILRDDNYIVGKGDKYGYDYYAHSYLGKLWGIYNARFGHFGVNVGGELSYTTFWREGLYKKGLFPNDSYGDSEHLGFFGYSGKANLTYTPNGMHSIQLSAIYQNNAPYFQDAFVSPRTRNTVTPDLTTEKIFSGDLAYNFRTPWIRMRVSAYYTEIKDQSKLISYYDDVWATFSNMAVSGIDSRYVGGELGFTMPLVADLTLSGAASVGDYTYNSNPTFTLTRDNTSDVIISKQKVYWKNMKIESTPQIALNLGLNYKTSNNIYLSVDAEYFDRMYLSMNPLYRTLSAMSGRIDASKIDGTFDGTIEDIIALAAIDGESDAIRALTAQEKFVPAFLLNASVGKTWYIGGKQLGFSLEIKNLTNTHVKTGGFEQMRLFSNNEYESGTGTRYSRFDSKYYYLYGTNYYLNIYFRF